jgi:hypothetical protein
MVIHISGVPAQCIGTIKRLKGLGKGILHTI